MFASLRSLAMSARSLAAKLLEALDCHFASLSRLVPRLGAGPPSFPGNRQRRGSTRRGRSLSSTAPGFFLASSGAMIRRPAKSRYDAHHSIADSGTIDRSVSIAVPARPGSLIDCFRTTPGGRGSTQSEAICRGEPQWRTNDAYGCSRDSISLLGQRQGRHVRHLRA